MDLSNYKIGYVPYWPGGNFAGDRRRFVFYAKEKGLNYEIASYDKKYDIVYLTMSCNFSRWLSYKKKYPDTRFVLEIIDTFYVEGLNFFTAFRGLVRFLNRKESKLYLDFRSVIKKMLHIADAVVCSTPPLREDLSKYNKNVHVSLDYFLNDITHKKQSFARTGKVKLVWEGLGYTVHHILYLKEVLEKLSDKVELHIITDTEIRYAFNIFNKKTAALFSTLECDYYLYKWEKETFSKIISEMDLAIIPLQNNKFGKLDLNKPENKLLLFWQIGIQVLTSASPAYCRVMDKAGLPFYCNSKEEWIEKIQDFIDQSEATTKQVIRQQADYIEQYHSKEIILRKWDDVFSSVYRPVENVL